MENKNLEGKVALVTGASRGIGRAIAICLASKGAKVIVNYNGSEDKANETVEEIKAEGGSACIYKCNVADAEAAKKMIDDVITNEGHLDILVNNAGITKDNLILRMSDEEFDAVIAANLKGTYNTIRYASKQFLKQKQGRIINLSSVSGVYGNPGQANYSASKAGVIGLTKSVAKELASRGITCNAVAPGYINTDMTQAMPDAAKEALLGQIPMKRAGEAKEVAATVAFLASEDASYITSQVIEVSGGM